MKLYCVQPDSLWFLNKTFYVKIEIPVFCASVLGSFKVCDFIAPS